MEKCILIRNAKNIEWMKVRWEKYLFSRCGWIFKALEGNGLLWLSYYLLALSLTGIMLSFDVRGFVSRNVSVGHALRNFRIFTGCQAGKTGPERLIHLGCASCRVDSIPPLFLGKDCCGLHLPEALPVPDAIQASRPEPAWMG